MKRATKIENKKMMLDKKQRENVTDNGHPPSQI